MAKVANKKALFVMLVGRVHRFEDNLLCLRVAQVPMAIFVLTMTTTMTQPITSPLAAHAGAIRVMM